MAAWTAQKVIGWLQAYDVWRAELAAHGLYRAPDGSQIRSTRIGRPTEQAALNLEELPGKVAKVEGWLKGLCWHEVIAAEFYMSGKPVATIAAALKIPTGHAERIVLTVPWKIMLMHYNRDLQDLTG